jgi:hypothetical protein
MSSAATKSFVLKLPDGSKTLFIGTKKEKAQFEAVLKGPTKRPQRGKKR